MELNVAVKLSKHEGASAIILGERKVTRMDSSLG